MMEVGHNPDVLSCLANLSNDEVFTPPAIANAMLDLLPQELFRSPQTTFLDPACKSGVFLREIAKRLIAGLADEIPDIEKRLTHIFTKQLFGIAITELTAHLSRRSVYCSKAANGRYSVVRFEREDGNVRYAPVKHSWVGGRCVFCGASQGEYDRGDELESHAYQFIHTEDPKEIFKMKFDVIVGNPPYQMGVGNEGGNSSKAKAIYHLFVEKAIKLSPQYLIMIMPSRWMTRSTEGISDEWIDDMLRSNHFEVIHDFEDSNDCFPSVSIMGGVNYFLWTKMYVGKTNYYYHTVGDKDIYHRYDYLDATNSGVVIRNPTSYNIIHKIVQQEGRYFLDESRNFSGLVSPKDFFTNKKFLTSSWDGYSLKKTRECDVKYYVNKNIHKVDFGWISEDVIPKHVSAKDLHKV